MFRNIAKILKTPTCICQNCKNCNNDIGKWIYHWYRHNLPFEQDETGKVGWWYIYCTKNKKYYRWDSKHFCFN